MDIDDGDLVRLARTGDQAAFRLLVERHAAMARARAARLSARPDDVDDVVQEAFLQAFAGLDRLRDPDRFGGWLAGIVVNVARAAARRTPPVLLADWPEPLHPVSALGLPSAEDLDRAEALRAAVADLPDGQRHAVELYYYADLPAGQIAGSPGAARARLHKARRRLREYITAYRPDLIPVASRRTPMTLVRIAHAQPEHTAQREYAQLGDARPAHPKAQHAQRRDGTVPIGRVLVVLTDDEGHRALPLWLRGPAALSLWWLTRHRSGDASGLSSSEPAGLPGELPPGKLTAPGLPGLDLAGQLLEAAGGTVTAVDISELGPGVLAAQIRVSSPAGSRQVTTHPASALALAAIMDAPVRVADALMDRLAVPVTGDDLPGQFQDRRPARNAGPLPGPRNLGFADGLDYWITGGSSRAEATGGHRDDYAVSAADGAATLSASVPHPYGNVFLGQVIDAGDYRGTSVTFRGEVRAEDVADQAEPFLFIVTHDRRPGPDVDVFGLPIAGRRDWTRYEITAQVPGDAELIRFGLTLTGPGQVALRNAELTHPSDPRQNTQP